MKSNWQVTPTLRQLFYKCFKIKAVTCLKFIDQAWRGVTKRTLTSMPAGREGEEEMTITTKALKEFLEHWQHVANFVEVKHSQTVSVGRASPTSGKSEKLKKKPTLGTFVSNGGGEGNVGGVGVGREGHRVKKKLPPLRKSKWVTQIRLLVMLMIVVMMM